MNKIGIEHFQIVLICDYPCENEQQLLWKERLEQDKLKKENKINSKRSIISRDEMLEEKHMYSKKKKKRK